MTASHFWSDSTTFFLARRQRCLLRRRRVAHCSYPTGVWWDTAQNKEAVVWSRCGVTLTQSSPETLHPWLRVTAPADWYPTEDSFDFIGGRIWTLWMAIHAGGDTSLPNYTVPHIIHLHRTCQNFRQSNDRRHDVESKAEIFFSNQVLISKWSLLSHQLFGERWWAVILS